MSTDNIVCNSGFVYGGYPIYTTDSPCNNNSKTNMKEQTLERFKLTFIKEVETEYTYEVLAENEEDAKKKVSEGSYESKTDKVLSVLTELVHVE